jgi:cysteine-rich repeat protein
MATLWFVVALAVLASNDHVLKGSGLLPGWLTGKLSDVAGMFVAPVVLAWLVRARSARAVAWTHVAVGVGFTAAELVPAADAALDALYGIFGYSWSATSDVTDLFVLPLLVVSHALVLRDGATLSRAPAMRFGERGIAFAGLAACIATTQTPVPSSTCSPEDCDQDGYGSPEDCNDYDPSLSPGYGCPALDGERHCDDGLDDDGDGGIDCADSDCALPCASIQEACEAAPQVDVAEVTRLVGATRGGSFVAEASCGGADAPEALYRIVAPYPGRLYVEVPDGHVVSVRARCEEASTELRCARAAGIESTGLLVVELYSADEVTVVVDARDGLSADVFDIAIDLVPWGCGDGTLDGGEQCDDGNVDSDDGCSRRCEDERGRDF